MLFYAVSGLVVMIDQLAKHFIRSYVEIGDTYTFYSIQITHIENSGMARGLLPGYGRLFGLIAVLFVIGVFYYRRTMESKGVIINMSHGFLTGGAVGNAIDRLLFGQVTDFIVSRSGRGVLNIADYAIEIGVFLMIVYAVIGYFTKKPAAKPL